jgi:hypothetical protein
LWIIHTALFFTGSALIFPNCSSGFLDEQKTFKKWNHLLQLTLMPWWLAHLLLVTIYLWLRLLFLSYCILLWPHMQVSRLCLLAPTPIHSDLQCPTPFQMVFWWYPFPSICYFIYFHSFVVWKSCFGFFCCVAWVAFIAVAVSVVSPVPLILHSCILLSLSRWYVSFPCLNKYI